MTGRLALIFCILTLGACAPLHVTPDGPTSNRDAILVLPGLGMRRGAISSVEAFADSADRAGFDLYLADFQQRQSLDHGVEKLRDFIADHELGDYRKVHVFAYILGGYTFNRLQEVEPIENLGNVVYDRSPLQELAPKLATTGWTQVPVRFALGPVVADLAATPYSPPPLPDQTRVGLIIENRATGFIRAHKARVLEELGGISFDADALGQPHDAAIHVPFNHDEMYQHFDVIGPELLQFFKHGKFSAEAARQALDIDPFAKKIPR